MEASEKSLMLVMRGAFNVILAFFLIAFTPFLTLFLVADLPWVFLGVAALVSWLAYRFALWPALIVSIAYLWLDARWRDQRCFSDPQCVGDTLYEWWVVNLEWMIVTLILLGVGITAGILRTLRPPIPAATP